MGQRRTINVSMAPPQKAFLEGLSRELGMPETQIVTRLLAWLESQDDVMHRGVLGLLPPSMLEDIKRLALKRLGPARKKKGKG